MKRNYYLFEVRNIKRNDNTLMVEKYDGKKISIPVEQINDIFVFSTMSFNTKFLDMISKNQICMHTFNYYGYYSGTYYPREKNVSGNLLVKQVSTYCDDLKRLEIAKEIIESSAFHIYRNLRYYKERGKNVEEGMKQISKLRNSIKYAKNIKQLMGIEGNIRKIYYSNWNEIIGNIFNFSKRVRQPPDNAINSLISFLNSVLYTVVLSEIYKTQLNPTISFLHEPGSKRFSLSLDISEIFKPLIVDRMIFSIINNKIINANSFKKDIDFLFIKEKDRKIILKKFDDKLNTKIMHRDLKREVTYRYLIRLEAYKLIKSLIEGSDYKAFKIWW